MDELDRPEDLLVKDFNLKILSPLENADQQKSFHSISVTKDILFGFKDDEDDAMVRKGSLPVGRNNIALYGLTRNANSAMNVKQLAGQLLKAEMRHLGA